MTEPSKMVERAARAIAAGYVQAKHGWSEDVWCDYVEDAKRAIQAMREPTDSMEGAAADTDAAQKLDYRRIWIAMIDEALK